MRIITPIENSRRHEEFCPLDTTLSILSGKWKSIIICRLMGSSQRFSSDEFTIEVQQVRK
ncbi:winged helix-turn-helix transcriptional regulator [Lactiplantibacillus plantarum]|uniref:winged helix-turn-helix transcriptional regulator n=1 Tax=Lactiplantibacillus plantarum TaxID=1590 RepID=UPI003B50345E